MALFFPLYDVKNTEVSGLIFIKVSPVLAIWLQHNSRTNPYIKIAKATHGKVLKSINALKSAFRAYKIKINF